MSLIRGLVCWRKLIKNGTIYDSTLRSLFVAGYSKNNSLSNKEKSERRKGRVTVPSHKDMEEAEDVHDWIENKITQQDVSDDVERGQEKHRQWLVKRIIERKYFKPSQETNLLTWAAKEQIRYLNAEYTDDWTPERLAESFKVSVDGIRRLLRSRFAPRSAEEITAHDRRVQLHWTALQAGSDDQQHKSAAGNVMLPMPPSKDAGVPKRHTPGLFESLLSKTHTPKTVCPGVDSKSMLSDGFGEDKHIAESCKFKTPKSDKNLFKSAVTSVGSKISLTANDDHEQCYNKFKSTSRHSEDVVDVPAVSPRRSLRGSRRRSDPDLQQSFDREEYAFKGTKKLTENVNVKQIDIEQLAYENEQIFKDKTNKDVTNGVDERRPDVRFDDDCSYIYDELKGYQYPYGRRVDLPDDNIDIDKECTKLTLDAKTGMKVYQKGNDFYDEDGEFLFRTP